MRKGSRLRLLAFFGSCTRASTAWLCAGLALLGACVDESTSVEKPANDAKLSNLSAAQERGLCDESNDLISADASYLDYYCIAQGVIAHAQDTTVACKQVHDECLGAPPPLCKWSSTSNFGGSCPDGTVGQYLDCIRGVQKVGLMRNMDMTCDTSYADYQKRSKDSVDYLKKTPPEECKPLLKACPKFFKP
jgi:hypothetical protein